MSSGGVRFKGTLMVTTVKTQLGSDLITPSTAQELLSVTPYGIPITHTADKTEAVNMELESDDTDLAPTKIAVLISGPEDASTTAAAATMIYKTYNLNVPITGGDVIQAHGTNIIDNTSDSNFGCGILISDQRTGRPQTYWSNPLAVSAYGTGNAAFVAGSTYRINNVARIVNAYGWAATGGTRTVDDSIGGNFKLESPDFTTNLPQIYPYQTMTENSLAAGHNAIPTMTLWNVNIPCDPVVAITEYLDNESSLPSAGGCSFLTGVGYNKTKIRR